MMSPSRYSSLVRDINRALKSHVGSKLDQALISTIARLGAAYIDNTRSFLDNLRRTLLRYAGMVLDEQLCRELTYLIVGNARELRKRHVVKCTYEGAIGQQYAYAVFFESGSDRDGLYLKLRVLTGPHAGDEFKIYKSKEQASVLAHHIGMGPPWKNEQRPKVVPFRFVQDLVGMIAAVEIIKLQDRCVLKRIFGNDEIRRLNREQYYASSKTANRNTS